MTRLLSLAAVLMTTMVPIPALPQSVYDAQQAAEPDSGFHFDHNPLNGRGQLRLLNATGHNAVLKLRGPSAEETFSWFLRSAKGEDATRQTVKELSKRLGGALDTATVLRGFLSSGSVTVVGIPDHDYTLQFCSGDGWVKSDQGLNGGWFAIDHRCSQLKYPARFEISEEADGLYSTAQYVTLRDVTGETVTTLPLTKQAFLAK